jgi:hypothetical protein
MKKNESQRPFAVALHLFLPGLLPDFCRVSIEFL